MAEILLILAIIICFLWGISYSDDNKESYLTLENTTRIKGLFALVIMGHHLTQSINDHSGIFLHKAGYIGVAVFLFYSGYGVIYKLRMDEHYLDGFFKKRILKILYPFFIVYVLYIIEDYLAGKPHTVMDIVKSFVNGVPYGSGTWYVIFIVLFYISFWIIATVTKRDIRKVLIGTVGFIVLWIVFCYVARYGQVWYVSSLAILVGMSWDIIKPKIHYLCDNYYVLTLIILFVLFMIPNVVILISQGGTYFYYFLEIVASTFFVFLVQVLNYRIQNKGKILMILGKISFEIYLVHGLFVSSLRGPLLAKANGIVYALAVISCSIVTGYLLHIMVAKINSILTGK